jgi:endonuclease III related protein
MARPKPGRRLMAYYRRLFSRYGSQNWWPGDGPFEVAAGAILVQNTAWRNAEKAILNLKNAGALTPKAIHSLPLARLSRLIRPSGTYRIKARRLKAFVQFLMREYDGSLAQMFRDRPPDVRKKLIELPGIGPETADSILLYAGSLPFFVIDVYTRRVFSRHGFIEAKADYDTLQQWIMGSVIRDAQHYNEFHALIVRVGKDFCGPKPDCRGCPLEPLLPDAVLV